MLNEKCVPSQAAWTGNAQETWPPESVEGPLEYGCPKERQTSLGEDFRGRVAVADDGMSRNQIFRLV